jgi:hypothetical protein
MLDVADRRGWGTKLRPALAGTIVLAPPGAARRAITERIGASRLLAATIILLAAFAIRGWQFGNPAIHVDENFYLLVGDRMLQGALPYVDIWDRKPIGLFLIYAATRLLGGDGVVQYQVVATLFAAGTAFVISRIAARLSSPGGAICAGIMYLFLLGTAEGTGGQAPVFYNLFVAGAALALVDVVFDEQISRSRLRMRGALAMILMGLAMQVKYSCVFEGLFFGTLLLYRARKIDADLASLASDAALWVGLALMPTCFAMLSYAWLGHFQEFMHANFLSIFHRSTEPASLLLRRLGKACQILAIPAVAILITARLAPWRQFPQGETAARFAFAWLGAALFGYLIFGSYFTHYLLPLAPPMALACAALFSHRPYNIGAIATGFLFVAGTIAYTGVVRYNVAKRGGPAGMEEVVAAIRPHLTGCLYLYDGDVMLYHKLNSCLLTKYPFPTHLNLTREANSVGVDPLAEIRRIFALRPSVVVDTVQANEETENPAANELARGLLQRDYKPIATFRHSKDTTVVYALVAPAPLAR